MEDLSESLQSNTRNAILQHRLIMSREEYIGLHLKGILPHLHLATLASYLPFCAGCVFDVGIQRSLPSTHEKKKAIT